MQGSISTRLSHLLRPAQGAKGVLPSVQRVLFKPRQLMVYRLLNSFFVQDAGFVASFARMKR